MTFHYLWLIWLWIFLSLSVKLTAHENSCNKLSFMSLTSNVCLVNNVYNFRHWPFPSSHLYYTLFPIDTEERNYVRTVKDVIFSKVNPVPLKSQLRLVAFSHDVLTNILNLNPMIADQPDFIYFVGGSFSTPASIPLSHRYGGHQFGHWADQLGDGRAVLLGEYVNNLGERWELQLKGSGKTPYSRRGDGRAVLRSSIREFLCSEAMYYLGIPTSRAAAIVVSDDEVIRDMFYDGHPQIERAAVVLRLAKSWFRIGSLEILQKSGEIDVLKQLVDFIIEKHFTSIDNEDKNKYTSFFWSVTNQTAILIALWQSVGFTHGVCNTDNFSLLSITIDYGPFGYLDEYNPGFVPNTSDDEGRYSYEKQPNVGIFNMEKLKIALFPLLTEKQKYLIDGVLNQYVVIYKTKFMQLFRNKLGFQNDHREEDERLLAILFKMMEETKSDFTTTFRDLGEISLKNLSAKKISKTFWALKTLKKHKWFDQWAISYVNRFNLEKTSDATRGYRMNKINPKYILRNWMAEQAISKAEQNDFSEVRILHNILTNPFTVQKEAEELKYSSKPPAWSKKLKVSCSS